jgi:glucosamine--fructose-6-phosphate aminotransferase (isomerizing)
LVKIKELEGKIADRTVTPRSWIGHTRWATHGRPFRQQFPSAIHDCQVDRGGGTQRHYRKLSGFAEELAAAGHCFSSETDIRKYYRNLIETYYQSDLLAAVTKTVSRLHGSYAMVAVCQQQAGCAGSGPEGQSADHRPGKNGKFLCFRYYRQHCAHAAGIDSAGR